MVSMSKKQPFEGAENAVKLSRECADVAIVTGANGSEIKKEWKNLDIMKYTDVLVSQERESWEEFPEALKRFCEGAYAGEYQEQKIQEFERNLRL